jgi:myo-inositol-1(or 4)-monophosphatase
MHIPTLADLEQLARQAGAILRESYDKEHDVSYKGVIDLVTEVDRASESFLIGEINRQFPGHSILAEESGRLGERGVHHWLIDPVDGTVNYAHHIPMFCVSIAYAFEGTVVLGAVYDPMRDEMYLAERGHGSTLNGRRLACAQAPELAKSLLVTGFPYDAWDTDQDNFANFVRFSKHSLGVRRFGSAALDLCYVGAGRFDGYWEMSLNTWDVAAAGLVAEEAGARVTNTADGPDYLSPPQSIVAANPALHAQILALLKEI